MPLQNQGTGVSENGDTESENASSVIQEVVFCVGKLLVGSGIFRSYKIKRRNNVIWTSPCCHDVAETSDRCC